MANEEHLKILKKGMEVWNKWREENPDIAPDLSEVDMSKVDLDGANLSRVDLSGAYLKEADIRKADLSLANLTQAYLCKANLKGVNLCNADLILVSLSGANLIGANLNKARLWEADLDKVNLFKANLNGADLSRANLSDANLSEAELREAILERVQFVETKLNGANLSGCRIYGISAWQTELEGTTQTDLIITPANEPVITVDNLDVAQFVHLLLSKEKIRNVIDTIGETGVLILGRFTKERKAVLDAIRNKLREFGFVPMMFDFEKPKQRDFTETIKTLAGLSRFIIADITNPKSSPLELQATMPDYMIPFVPIIQEDEKPFAMFQDLQQKYGDWVLDVLKYDSADNLLKVLDKAVIKPALKKADELLIKKAEGIRDRHVKDYI